MVVFDCNIYWNVISCFNAKEKIYYELICESTVNKKIKRRSCELKYYTIGFDKQHDACISNFVVFLNHLLQVEH